MALFIQTNVASLTAQNNLAGTTNELSGVFERLSSGYRINHASDDAAGLGIADTMDAQIQSYTVAQRNANDGISALQVADGAAGQVTDILTRMRVLAEQSSNGTLGSADRVNIQAEFGQLQNEVNRIANGTTFNGKGLLSGGMSATTAAVGGTYATSGMVLQVGTGTGANDKIKVRVVSSNFTAFSAVKTTICVSGVNASNSQTAITAIDKAIKSVAKIRATFGAMTNRLQDAVSGIQTVSTNLSAAHSRIKDVDVASETSNLSRLQVLQQAGTAILSQANQTPQTALSLLK